MHDATYTFLGPLSALLSSCVWAVGSTAYGRLGKSHAGPRIHFSRALVALPLFMILAAFTLPRPIDWAALFSTPALTYTLLSVIVSFALGDVLFLLSTRSLGVPGALALASTYPLFAALSGAAFRGETLTLPRAAGVTLMVIGTMGVILAPAARRKRTREPASPSLFTAKERGAGVILALLTSFCWALNVYAVSGASDAMQNPAAVNCGRMAMSLVMCPVVGYMLAPFTGQRFKSPFLPRKTFFSNAWVFALEGFGGALLFTYGVGHSPMAVSAPLTALAPVLAVPVGWFTGSEPFDAIKTTAVTLVVAGIVLLS